MSATVSFEVLEIRASGAYATVCRAVRANDALRRVVAVKALRATLVDNARALMRTRDEARLLARLSHPNIVKVEELLSLERRPILVMEWVEGVSLRELLDLNRNGIYVGAALAAVSQCSRALDAAWSAVGDRGQPLHIVHRDVKPGNLLVTPHGAIKVVDFGLSRGEYFERETTTVSTVLGSMGYMAPERFRTGIGDHPSIDIYALGLTLTELITGRLPLLARDPALHDRGVASIAEDLRPQGMHPNAVGLLRELVIDMCRFEPEQRPGYVELRDRINEIQHQGGLEEDMIGFAQTHVQPLVEGRPRVEPRSHPKWEEVAFLEDPGDDDEIPLVEERADSASMADQRVRRFIGHADWAERKRELKWLLALHPEWTAAPFLEVLQRTTRPWWVFWAQQVSATEVAVALEILRHRPSPEVLPFADQLIKHRDKRVSDAAQVVLDRLNEQIP